MTDLLKNDVSKAMMSWGKWLALVISVFVIMSYGTEIGAVTTQVEHNTVTLEQHSVKLNAGDRWTKQDHLAYDSKVNARLGRMESKMDKIYILMIEKNRGL